MSRTTLFLALSFVLIASTPSHAQTVSAKGQGIVTYEGRLDPEDRRAAIGKAKVSALELFLAGQPTLLRSFNQRRAELTTDIDRYIVGETVLGETEDKKSRTFSVILRVEFSEARLRADLDSTSATAKTSADPKTPIVMVFMAREQASVQSFDDKVYKRADARVESSNDGRYKERTQEGESITGSSITTSGSISRSQTSTSQGSVSTTTGGSTTRRSDVVTWKVSTVAGFDNAISENLAAAGFEVTLAEFVIGQNLELIRNDFSTDSDLSPAVLQATVNQVRTLGIRILALGTMDVGVRSIDPTTGLVRVTVTISGKVLDLSGRFPKVLTALSAIQYAGLGADESTARTKALQIAADEASKEMVDALNAKQFR
jgi:hypothetical protein